MCNGDGKSCAGCDNVPWSGATLNNCGLCGSELLCTENATGTSGTASTSTSTITTATSSTTSSSITSSTTSSSTSSSSSISTTTSASISDYSILGNKTSKSSTTLIAAVVGAIGGMLLIIIVAVIVLLQRRKRNATDTYNLEMIPKEEANTSSSTISHTNYATLSMSGILYVCSYLMLASEGPVKPQAVVETTDKYALNYNEFIFEKQIGEG